MRSLGIFALAALFEIGGCFAFWATVRLGKPLWVAAGGVLALVAFAALLTQVASPFAGRAYAAYGGVYIITSLAWLGLVERVRPDRWDIVGSCVCLVGALVILFGPRR